MEESNRHTKADPLRLARRRLAPLELASLEGKQHLGAEVLQLLLIAFTTVCHQGLCFCAALFGARLACFLSSYDMVRTCKPCMCTHGNVVYKHKDKVIQLVLSPHGAFEHHHKGCSTTHRIVLPAPNLCKKCLCHVQPSILQKGAPGALCSSGH